MIKLDETFEFHETKFHHVVWALLLHFFFVGYNSMKFMKN